MTLIETVVGRSKALMNVMTALGMLLVVSGCGGGDAEVSRGEDAGMLPEAIAVRQAFEGDSPSIKNPVTQVLSIVTAGSVSPEAYAEALPQLQRPAGISSLSPEQKQALEALIQRLRSELSAGSRP